MSFQKFCSGINDGQKITAEKTFILTFTNTKGEEFSISPDKIRLFLKFFIESYNEIQASWLLIQTRKDLINKYEEKSYREIYKAADLEELRIISSIGRSQTKALTQLIAKVISFVIGEDYSSPEENTFLTKEYILQALKSWGQFFPISVDVTNNFKKERAREEFYQWMISSGLSERSSKSYSGTGINFSDKFLAQLDLNKNTLYLCRSSEVILALALLKNIPEWSEADVSGNSMYSSALKKLSEFLSEKERLSILSKPFLLLAGISGTGKTRFVREQAKATGSLADTYCLTPVRSDWHEPSDLLGYISRLNGAAEYIATDVLKFIAKAWRAKVDAGLSLGVNDTDKEQHGYLIVSGAAGDLNAIPPYWLCLDEMNLAPVEQYFADYLSILETREWCWEDDAFKYFSAPLLTAGTLQHLGKLERDKLRKHLGFKNEGEAKAEDELWGLICEYGMGIPFNLIVAGTVNMDETTHGFSRKVIDRALSFDFGEFFPNNYDEFFESNSRNKRLSYPIWSQARQEDLANTCDADGSRTLAFLSAVNAVLKNTPFELAYRALNELLLAVISSQPQDELTLKAVWDDFMMCKVLPRIEGDSDKLTTAEGKELLVELQKVLAVQLAPIWDADENNDQTQQRPDLYRENAVAENAAEDEKLLHIACRSKGKLKWMEKRLGSAMFTSFWP